MSERLAWRKLARRVGSGAAIDWADARARHADRGALAMLRVLERIARARPDRVPMADVEQRVPSRPEHATRPRPASERPRVPASWGPLTLRAPIGAGSYARVFRAHDPRVARDVALKLFPRADRSRRARFMDEALRMARVRHDNVVRVLGADVFRGRVGIWSELLEGPTLEAWLAVRGPLDPCTASHVGIDLCRGLAAVHRAGLVHGDVKTANVIRTADGRVVLLDFGSATEMEGRGGAAAPITGTPAFLAPELLRGAPAEASADLFALGKLLDRLVTGGHGTAIALRERLRAAESPRDRGDAALERIIARATRAEPEERWPSATAMEEELRDVVDAHWFDEARAGRCGSGDPNGFHAAELEKILRALSPPRSF